MLDLIAVGTGAGAIATSTALFGWCLRFGSDGPAGGNGHRSAGAGKQTAQAQLAPPTPKIAAASLAPTAGLARGGRSPYPYLPPAEAAERFLKWLAEAEIKAATAHEAWLLYGEHCLTEELEQLPANVIMAEVGKRVWRGQKRMGGGERPTVYAFDQEPAPPPRKLTLVERRRLGMCRPVQLRAA